MQAWRPEFQLQNPHQGGRREQLILRLPQTYDDTHTITNKSVLFSFEKGMFDKYDVCGEGLEGRVARAGPQFGVDTETLVSAAAPADSKSCSLWLCYQGENEVEVM